jgi:hypothetical protein
MTQSNAAVATRAAELVQELGLCKYQNYAPDGSVCVARAVELAADLDSGVYDAVLTAVGNEITGDLPEMGRGHVAAVHYNNRCETTQADVVRLLRRTASRLGNSPEGEVIA